MNLFNKCLGVLKKVPGWVLTFLLWIVTDARSATIGAIVASVINIAYDHFHDARPPREVELFVDQSGHGMPMPALQEAVKQDSKVTSFVFQPVALEKVYVCEYAHISGYTSREIMLSYLSKYSTCFSVSQIDRDSYQIRPNRNYSSELKEAAGGWFCNCS